MCARRGDEPAAALPAPRRPRRPQADMVLRSAWYRAAYGLPADAVALAHFLTMRGTGRVRADGGAHGRCCICRHIATIPMRARIRSRIISTICCATCARHFRILRFVSEVGTDRSQLLSDQRQRRARGGAGSGRSFLPLRLARGTQAEYLFRYTMVSTDQSRRGAACGSIRWCTMWLRVRRRAGGRCRISIRSGIARPMTFRPARFALAHFLTHRRSQKFSPTPMFDVAWYVEQHAEELGNQPRSVRAFSPGGHISRHRSVSRRSTRRNTAGGTSGGRAGISAT